MKTSSWLVLFVLTSLMQVLDGQQSVWTVCGSMCRVKQDGFLFFVVCHTPTPNSFRVDTADQTSLFTGTQVIRRIIKHGIATLNCSPKQRNSRISHHYVSTKMTDGQTPSFTTSATKDFTANTIFAAFETGTYSYSMKRKKWIMIGTSLRCLQKDVIRKRVVGCKENAVVYFDATREGTQQYNTLLTFFDERISICAYDVRTEDIFIIDTNEKLHRKRKIQTHINKAGRILDIKLDQDQGKMYLLVRHGGRDTLCSARYGAGRVHTLLHMDISLLISHFDYLYTTGKIGVSDQLFAREEKFFKSRVIVGDHRLVVRYVSRKRTFYYPGEKKLDGIPNDVADIDYDDMHMYILSDKMIQIRKRNKSKSLTIKAPKKWLGNCVTITVF